VIALVAVLTLSVCGCELLHGRPLRTGSVTIQLKPDGKEFAYALEYRTVPPMWFSTGGEARVEVWRFDLARGKGPKKIGGWSHDFDWSPSLAGWTSKGLYLRYHGPKNKTRWEWVDPATGIHLPAARDPSDEIRQEGLRMPDSNHSDEYRATPHVEQHHGMFTLWDPAAYRLVPLFELPLEAGAYSSVESERKKRETQTRQEGFQGVASVDWKPAGDGLMLTVRTFARTPAPFVRRYELHMEFQVPEPGEHEYETNTFGHALLDTSVTPDPAGERIELFVPYATFYKVLRPERPLVRDYGHEYSANLVTTLIPDSLAGDEGVPPGIRDGGVSDNWTFIKIPLP
jgi:hypothetical protein